MTGRVDIVVSFDWAPMVGGAHGWIESVYRHWPSEVDVFTCPVVGTAGCARQDSLTIHRIAMPIPDIDLASPAFWRRMLENRSLLSAMARGRPTVLHALRAFPEGLLACVLGATRRGVQVVTYAHGEELMVARTSRALALCARWVYRRSSRIIANSANTARLVSMLEPGCPVTVIHPGVTPRTLPDRDASRRALRAAYGWHPDAIVVLSVARMERRKNHRAVIDAVSDARDCGLDVVAICAGDGPEHDAVCRHVQDRRLTGSVILPGYVTEDTKWQLLAGADIFAMPSITVESMLEGFGIVFMEAAWAGLPCVAGISGGQAEAVLNGKTGLAVNGDRRDEVSRAIELLARDAGLRRSLGEAGRRRAAELDADAMRDRLWRLFRDESVCAGVMTSSEQRSDV